MEFISGYTFNTIEEAEQAVIACTEYYSPLPEGWIWTDYIIEKSNGLPIIFIPYDESLEPILGEPTNIQIDDFKGLKTIN